MRWRSSRKSSARRAREKLVECLDRLFRVRVCVDKQPATLVRVDPLADGRNYTLLFKLPEECKPWQRLLFEIVSDYFQPRSQNSLPMVISEPTRDVKQHFYYSKASIENVGYFIGATVGPGSEGKRVTPEHDDKKKFIGVTGPPDIFLTPGEGTVAYWMPLQKGESIRLVRLNEADHGIIDARYATTDNLFEVKLYESSELFLVSEAAEQLQKVNVDFRI